MAPRPTVIGTQGYRRGLASLSVVKELLFRVHRNVPTDRVAVATKNCLGTLSGGTYSSALRELAFQLCLPQLPLSFCFVFKSFATCFGIPLRKLATRHSPLITAGESWRPRAICNYTSFLLFVKPPRNNYFGPFSSALWTSGKVARMAFIP